MLSFLTYFFLINMISSYELNIDMPMPQNSSFTLTKLGDNPYLFNCYDVANSIIGYYRKQTLGDSPLLCKSKYNRQFNNTLDKVVCQTEENINKITYDIEMWCEKVINMPITLNILPICTISLSSYLSNNDIIIQHSCFVTVNVTDNRSFIDKLSEPISWSLFIFLIVSIITCLYAMRRYYTEENI